VGAASSRDRFNSRLARDELGRVEAAPTGVFIGNLGLPDKRKKEFSECLGFGV
jgi:hypothetical protein